MAIPLDEEGVRAGLEDSSRDFVRNLARANGIRTPDGMRMSVESLWREVYQPIALYAEQVLQYVQKKGVHVSKVVGISEFAETIGAHRVTTLVAHWRNPLFRREDVVDLDLFIRLREDLRRRESHQSELSELSAEQLVRVLEIRTETFDGDVRQKLADALNGALLGAMPVEHVHKSGLETRTQIGFEKSRATLSNLLPGALVGGAAIELSDGLHSISELVSVVAPDWRGTLDLTVCNSTVLGNAIRLRARGSLVVMNEEPADLVSRLALYKQVIRMISHRKQSYMRCMLDMHAHLV